MFRLDGNGTNVVLNGTNSDDGPTLVWSADNMGDGDHQLYMLVGPLQQNGSVAVDYLEYVLPSLHFVPELCSDRFAAVRVENSSGKGFDLLWAGSNATNVPKEAIIVDNTSPNIVLSNASQWDSSGGVDHYGQSLLVTTQPGASFDFSFTGVAIWYACVSYI